MTNEKIISPLNGYFMLFLFVVLFFGGIGMILKTGAPWYGFVTLLGKVNDKLGNPVMISTILVWRVTGHGQ